MGTQPVFATTPKTGIAQLSTANLTRDGSGTIVSLFTPGASGSRATSLRITATVTTGAQLVRLYRSTDSGTTWVLWQEVSISAVTIATGTAGASAFLSLVDSNGNALGLAATDRLGAAPELAQAMNVVTEYADL